MTPQQKAKQLYNTFYSTNVHPNSIQVRDEIAKEFAIKCADEIIEVAYWNGVKDFYKEVKQEIEKL